ncbi:unnamed protein product [Symbiodinium sp. CCMP2456]|nr:unnamed protein product [Symbiodinium sp. CCMP2456]
MCRPCSLPLTAVCSSSFMARVSWTLGDQCLENCSGDGTCNGLQEALPPPSASRQPADTSSSPGRCKGQHLNWRLSHFLTVWTLAVRTPARRILRMSANSSSELAGGEKSDAMGHGPAITTSPIRHGFTLPSQHIGTKFLDVV